MKAHVYRIICGLIAVLGVFLGSMVKATIAQAESAPSVWGAFKNLQVTEANPKVDPAIVGTWEIMVPNSQGVARWVWEIHADGTYSFHSEGSRAAPPHSGNVTFMNGMWALQATTGLPGWTDGGTYQVSDPNTLVATGRLGTGIWRRIAGAETAVEKGKTKPLNEGFEAIKSVSPDELYARLTREHFVETLLEPGFSAPRIKVQEVTAQDLKGGMLGKVIIEFSGPVSRNFVEVRVYKSAEVAKKAFDNELFLLRFQARAMQSEMEFDVRSHTTETTISSVEGFQFSLLDPVGYGGQCPYLFPGSPVVVVGIAVDPPRGPVKKTEDGVEYEVDMESVKRMIRERSGPLLLMGIHHLLVVSLVDSKP